MSCFRGDKVVAGAVVYSPDLFPVPLLEASMFLAQLPKRAACLLAWASVTWGAASAGAQEFSQLWGEHGELWSTASRLPDFSYAGYGRGERPIPAAPAQANVKDFGARGDGQSDDTVAFRRAVDAAAGKTILVPAGKYVITDFVTIRASGTVLQGEGPERSVLYFPTPLETIKPNPGATTTGRPTSNYSWSGGFIEVRGEFSDRPLSQVTTSSARGERELAVDHPECFRAGLEVRLVVRDTPDNSLARCLYAGDSGPVDNLEGKLAATFLARVVDVEEKARRLRLDRPLRWDVRLEWDPQLYSAESSVEEVGIEGLAFEFPVTPYAGHFTEQGYNAIALRGVRNCWVRDVAIRHSDSGVFVSGHNVTLSGIVLESERRSDGERNSTGHHGVTLGGTDCLLSDFDFGTRFIHDITMTRGSAGNVAMNGRGVDLALDHHRYAPHANLFTNLDAGEGSRLFQSGGGAELGWHCGAWETFWNIRTRQPQRWPGAGSREPWSCDRINLVGVVTQEPSRLDPQGRWLETIAPERLSPPNLYEAQLAARLKARTAAGHGKTNGRTGGE
jgi:hypothetical protein